eukprot:TRINITY_DN2952_c0_g1_i3.p2 TRINITY_DN2952_c0_g1~~TRINITY_DN2952_c0_g1_i3.p2  ORF type:complete len:118 (+),score=32.74 TRINITY_DN2952_c0_g1_i3:599-952(+)
MLDFNAIFNRLKNRNPGALKKSYRMGMMNQDWQKLIQYTTHHRSTKVGESIAVGGVAQTVENVNGFAALHFSKITNEMSIGTRKTMIVPLNQARKQEIQTRTGVVLGSANLLSLNVA